MEDQNLQQENIITDPVIEPYFIQMDDYNYTLCIRNVAEKSGREYNTSIGYFSSFSKCISTLASILVKKGTYTSIDQFLQKYNEIIDKLTVLKKYE
jgi:hypothetical protein